MIYLPHLGHRVMLVARPGDPRGMRNFAGACGTVHKTGLGPAGRSVEVLLDPHTAGISAVVPQVNVVREATTP